MGAHESYGRPPLKLDFVPDQRALDIWQNLPGELGALEGEWTDAEIIKIVSSRMSRLVALRKIGGPQIIIAQEKVLITTAVAALLRNGGAAERWPLDGGP